MKANFKLLISENKEVFVEMVKMIEENPQIGCDAETVFNSVYSIWSCYCPKQTLAETWADEKPYWIERGYGTL